MKKFDSPVARRTVIKGAGFGLVAGALAGAPAQSAVAAASEGGEIWSSEYWAKKGDIPLWMYRKRVSGLVVGGCNGLPRQPEACRTGGFSNGACTGMRAGAATTIIVTCRLKSAAASSSA